MNVLDVNGNKIQSGMFVKYIGTHTAGKVDKIVVKERIVWIKLDSNSLYYRRDYIEVIKDKKLYIKQRKSKKSKSEKFDIEIPVEISDTTDGPGIGGG